MSDLERRRLMDGKSIKDFIIFDTALREGKVVDNKYSTISANGYINIIGAIIASSNTRSFLFRDIDGYSTDAECRNYINSTILAGEDLTDWTVVFAYNNEYPLHWDSPDGDDFNYFFYWVYPKGESPNRLTYSIQPGEITLGNYDFKNYKKINFTVSDYQGKSFFQIIPIEQSESVDEKVEITHNGQYSISIKNLQNSYNIKFGREKETGKISAGCHITNIYLEG